MNVYNYNVSLITDHFNEIHTIVCDYIKNSGRQIAYDDSIGFVRIFGKDAGSCDRLYYVGDTNNGYEVCVCEYIQASKMDEGYIGYDLDDESAELTFLITEYFNSCFRNDS